LYWPSRSYGGHSLGSYRGDPDSSQEPVMWHLWWTKRQWDRLSPCTPVSPAILPTAAHSTPSSGVSSGPIVVTLPCEGTLTIHKSSYNKVMVTMSTSRVITLVHVTSSMTA
jgi:hypothetical protein